MSNPFLPKLRHMVFKPNRRYVYFVSYAKICLMNLNSQSINFMNCLDIVDIPLNNQRGRYVYLHEKKLALVITDKLYVHITSVIDGSLKVL